MATTITTTRPHTCHRCRLEIPAGTTARFHRGRMYHFAAVCPVTAAAVAVFNTTTQRTAQDRKELARARRAA